MQVRTPALGTVEEVEMASQAIVYAGAVKAYVAAVDEQIATGKTYKADPTAENFALHLEALKQVIAADLACKASQPMVSDLSILFAGSDETEAAHEWQDEQADVLEDMTADPDPWSPAEIAAKAKEDMEEIAYRDRLDADDLMWDAHCSMSDD